MAITISSLSAITRRYFYPSMVDEITTSMALLTKMKSDGRMTTIDGGDSILQPVTYARNATVMNYQGDQTLNVAYNEKKTALSFDWAQKSGAITITGLDEIKNAGAAKVLSHLETETEIAKRDMKHSFATGLYSAGTDALEILGARTFLSTTASYGGLSQSTESWLQAQIDSTTTAFSLGKWQELFEKCKEDDDKPNFCTMYETYYNALWNLLQPQQRFASGDMAKAGFESLLVNGTPCVNDSYVPSGYVILWNLKHFKLVSSSKRNFPGELQDFVKPTNQDARTALILWAGQAICDEPRKLGAFTALTS